MNKEMVITFDDDTDIENVYWLQKLILAVCTAFGVVVAIEYREVDYTEGDENDA